MPHPNFNRAFNQSLRTINLQWGAYSITICPLLKCFLIQCTSRVIRVTFLVSVSRLLSIQVAPAELEDLLQKHPAVLDAAVIGMPDDRAGELPRAYVVSQPDAYVTPPDILKYVEGIVDFFLSPAESLCKISVIKQP